MNRHSILTAFAPLVLVACAHAESLGGFDFEVPQGWEVETEDGSMILVAHESAWVWAFAIEDARALQDHEGGLTGAAREIAQEVTAEEQQSDGAFSIGEPTGLELGEEIVAVEMQGQATVEGIAVGVRVVIAIAGSEALVGIGFRAPNADAKVDAKSEGLIQSIRAGR